VYHCSPAKYRRATATFSPSRGGDKELLSITVRTLGNKILQLNGFYPSTNVRDIKLLIESKHNVPATLQTLSLLDKPLDDQKTFDQCGITNGAVINLAMNLRKPMIYLFGPGIYLEGRLQSDSIGTQNVEVRLSLDRAWELSILHPSMRIYSRDYVQSVTWTVDVKPNGALLDHSSGSEMSYLFWDGL
jgi:hypothetical protein